jgi:hypothetical protein
MYTNMVEAATGAWVESARAATGAQGGKFIAVLVTHVQDEAEIRILTGHARDGPQIPRRQRASKVQSHVMEIVCKGRCIKIPTELEALGDKKAPTLATLLEGLLRLKITPVLQPPAQTGACSSHRRKTCPITWVVHILIGDAIPTNEAAAKLLLSMVRQRPLGPNSKYFLVLLKCGTHQAGLSVKEGLLGRAATAGSFGKFYWNWNGEPIQICDPTRWTLWEIILGLEWGSEVAVGSRRRKTPSEVAV